ncbi:hypothetical protein AF72_01850 [Xylella taiwanensis]|uniref:Uncharacterized protein n=1 Tax=Xylella taiwanensis TaxID=1444770 RepID=Z9JND6_9GAMM|nr:hypothetical protein AB672_04590 [Xylella taiwanensis]EWS79267.1 hypothetical protein AF72_01850 [Xylella taiwanensis]
MAAHAITRAFTAKENNADDAVPYIGLDVHHRLTVVTDGECDPARAIRTTRIAAQNCADIEAPLIAAHVEYKTDNGYPQRDHNLNHRCHLPRSGGALSVNHVS